MVREKMEQLFLTGKSSNYEVRVDMGNSDVSWYSTQIGAITIDGKIVGANIVTTDVTPRKKGEEELVQKNQEITERVKELQCLYGISDIVQREELLVTETYQQIVDIIPGSWQHNEVACARIVVEGKEFQTDNFKKTKWKQEASISLAGKDIGTVEVFYLKEMPESDEGPFHKEERRLILEIAKKLGRFVEHSQAKHRISEVMQELKRKNEELDDYTYTVSHDLKSPLITLQGFSSLLTKNYADELDEKGVHYIDRISEASESLGTLVSDLLKLSRAGRKTGDFMDVKAGNLIDATLESLEGFVNEKKVAVKYGELPTIRCDRIKMGQVFNNLIGNAIKYMGEQDKPKIDIGWDEDKDYYKFWVADNGMGIKDSDKDRIFKPFQRSSVPTTVEGTGIGLNIVKKIVGSHHGNMWVESEFGKGSTFYFTIPKYKESSNEPRYGSTMGREEHKGEHK
jgi:signal transduction histidine kinase